MTETPRPSRDEAPVLRVVHGGEPTAEELAAVVAALAELPRRTATETSRAGASLWSDRRRALRRPLSPGRGAWVASTRP